MTTKSGFITNGTYIKYKSGFTSLWIVETEKERLQFYSEAEADNFIQHLLKKEESHTQSHFTLDYLLSRFDNGIERYNMDCTFHVTIDCLVYGSNPINVIGNLLEVVNNLQQELSKLHNNSIGLNVIRPIIKQ